MPIEVKSGKSYKTHASLDDLLAVSEYGLGRALVLSSANVSEDAAKHVRYLPVYYLMFLRHDGLPEDAHYDPPLPQEKDIVFATPTKVVKKR